MLRRASKIFALTLIALTQLNVTSAGEKKSNRGGQRAWRCALLIENLFLSKQFDEASLETIRKSFIARLRVLSRSTGENTKAYDLQRMAVQARSIPKANPSDLSLAIDVLRAVALFTRTNENRIVGVSSQWDMFKVVILDSLFFLAESIHRSHDVQIRERAINAFFDIIAQLPLSLMSWHDEYRLFWERDSETRTLYDLIHSTMFFDEWVLIDEDSFQKTEDWLQTPWMQVLLPLAVRRYEEIIHARPDLKASFVERFNDRMRSSSYRTLPEIVSFQKKLNNI